MLPLTPANKKMLPEICAIFWFRHRRHLIPGKACGNSCRMRQKSATQQYLFALAGIRICKNISITTIIGNSPETFNFSSPMDDASAILSMG